ncbi:hypothetical protein [Actibacterium sp.]|uniref:hypothetical protein n=1 Tax=Actibacterium sp. TaxID=1872125 RepID=UPI0035687CD5
MADTSAPGRPARRKAQTGIVELVVMLAVATLALVYGWNQRHSGDLTAETGVGYILGIVGSVFMLLLLIYPLRKRIRALAALGGVPTWFRLHMMLGIAGPVLIILHSNYKLGSLNSTVALSSMLIVAGSGLIGRFFYARIHRGLYGRRHELDALRAEVTALRGGVAVKAGDAVDTCLRDWQRHRLNDDKGLMQALIRVWTGPFARARISGQVLALAAPQERAAMKTRLRPYLRATARVQGFVMYERLFALWHLLHLPLFFILVLAALAHVVAVHLY